MRFNTLRSVLIFLIHDGESVTTKRRYPFENHSKKTSFCKKEGQFLGWNEVIKKSTGNFILNSRTISLRVPINQYADGGAGCWTQFVLVTSLRFWWRILNPRLKMLMTFFTTNIMSLPPTFQSCQRHEVTNITVLESKWTSFDTIGLTKVASDSGRRSSGCFADHD